MGRSRRDLRRLNFGMAILLACPWQIVVSAAESWADAWVLCAHKRLDAPARHVQQPGALSRWSHGDYPSLALTVADLGEEDEGSPQALIYVLNPLENVLFEIRDADATSVLSRRNPSQRSAIRPRLRC